ncbi:MAG: 3'-phosphoesterase [Candidatus Omnitrophica bacterium]|nr:3'-phosphoesterase [Candidatus Omnitrophota bacterium]
MAIFVVQEHHAKRLHWDFRLEVAGVLKSWAVPKGPSLDPQERHLAIQVADHDLKHADYEGIIPDGQYGSGPVLVWDRGTYELIEPGNADEGLRGGKLSFQLKGSRLKGAFSLVKMRKPGLEKEWLLIKKKDDEAREGWKIPVLLDESTRKKLKVKNPSCSVQD